MDIDNQSEDGEIKKSPSKDMDDFRVFQKLFRGGWGRYSRLFGHKTTAGCRSPSQI